MNNRDYAIRGAVVLVKRKLSFKSVTMKMCHKINLRWNSLAEKEKNQLVVLYLEVRLSYLEDSPPHPKAGWQTGGTCPTLQVPIPLCWWQAQEPAWQALTKHIPLQWVKLSVINSPDDRGCAANDLTEWWKQLQNTFRLKAARVGWVGAMGDFSCLQRD